MFDIPFSLYWRDYFILFVAVVLLELAALFAFAQTYGLVREIKKLFKERNKKNG